jgi:hypothetical protein
VPGYCAQLESPLLTTQVGFSDVASRVKGAIEKVLSESTSQRLENLIYDILGLWDEASIAQDLHVRKTASAAIWFALQLPPSLPVPEVSLDPDGEVSFDWTGTEGERFSVSVNEANRLAFAGRFSEMSKVYGVEQLSKFFPSEITRGIQRTIRYHRG